MKLGFYPVIWLPSLPGCSMSLFKRSFLISLFIFLLTGIAFGSGWFARDYLGQKVEFPLLNEAYDLLQTHGLNDLPPAPALEYGMIRGMLQSYGDPYTLFIEPVQHELESNALQGSFGGIGVQITRDLEGFWVLYPFPDSPAASAGVQEGDRLLAIEDLPVAAETPLDTIQSAIRGPIGQRVTLTVARLPAYSPIQLSVPRSEFPLPSVVSHLVAGEEHVGVIKVNLIAASTAGEIQEAVEDLQSRGATHFVLDLRDNPGGLLTAGVDIARLFLQEGVVMEQQYRGEEVDTFRVEKPGPLAGVPLSVLINHGSASAAEIVAGALQVQDRALLIGSPTYGKDTIQLVFVLADDSSLHVTAARWWVPGLDPPIGEDGLQPDLFVAPPGPDTMPAVDDALQKAVEVLIGTE